MTNWLKDLNGTHADCVLVPASALAAAPANVGLTAAAALPVNALTAAQALDLLPLTGGDTLVVIGAAGAVGGFALELAVDRGLRVLGVAGRSDEPFIRTRGGTFIDREADLGASVCQLAPGSADGLLDTASVGAPALAAVRDHGTYCGVIHPLAPPSERSITITTVGVHSDPVGLARLVRLAEQGTLTLRVAARYALADAAQAHDHVAKGGNPGVVFLEP